MQDLETIFRAEFMGEMKGLNQASQLLSECVVYSEGDKKNYIDGDKFIRLIRERRKLLIDRQVKNVQEY